MERVLKRIFYLMDICGNKRVITSGVTHMSGPSGGGRGPGLGGQGRMGQRRDSYSSPWQLGVK